MFGSYECGSFSNQSVAQNWEFPGEHYQSTFEYNMDPVLDRVRKSWASRQVADYSLDEKAFNPVTPYSSQKVHYVPYYGHFAPTRLRQTDVWDIISSKKEMFFTCESTSVGSTIEPLIDKMGIISDLTTVEDLGTCTLIAYDLVLVARHSIEGHDVCNIETKFGWVQKDGGLQFSGKTKFTRIVEEDAQSDYAIVQLKQPIGKRLGFVALNTEGTLSEPALLHYPLGNPLKVSVHALSQSNYKSLCMVLNHDSDFLSSGGAYFDIAGRMVAIHLGIELGVDTMNLERHALSLERIVEEKPNSILKKLASGELSQAALYSSDSPLCYLLPSSHQYLIEEEGPESEKILRALLEKELRSDKQIALNKNRTIEFSSANLRYIRGKYPKKFGKFKQQCLGWTGLHGATHKYSVKNEIESDHALPHNVWKTTKNPKLRQLVQGGGKRPGENDMPAITIPYDIHRSLLTTGGVPGCKEFHKSLTGLCDQGHIDDALIKCYEEYENKGINLDEYKDAIKASLGEYVDLGAITKSQKKRIEGEIF